AQSPVGGDLRSSFYRGLQQSRDRRHDEHFGGGDCGDSASYACPAKKRLQAIGEGKTMKHNDKDVQAHLDDAITEIKEQQPEAGTIRAASERVWKNLRQEIAAEPRVATSIRGCDDVRSLLPQYRSGQLSPARALLVEAHLHECVACRGYA